MIRALLVCAAVVLSSGAEAQRAADSERVGAVISVIEYRVVFMDDTTRFDACSVRAAMGNPPVLSAVLTRRAQ
ncbi:MAG TPA: hypothetical protein VF613_06690, partial [Longimicrobium sp.]